MTNLTWSYTKCDQQPRFYSKRRADSIGPTVCQFNSRPREEEIFDLHAAVKALQFVPNPTLGVTGCEKRHSFRQYNSARGREAWCISKWRGVESKGHRLDMTDNTPNTKQCDREVELTSPGFTTLTSQLGLAPIPHTFLSLSLFFSPFFFYFIFISSSSGENSVHRAAGPQTSFTAELWDVEISFGLVSAASLMQFIINISYGYLS